MGRYYNTTATPQFVEGMYTPPWELINKSLEANQQGYENVLTTTNLFNDIDIQHIEDPIIKEQAQKLKDYYTGRAEDITKAIQKDPTAWRKANPEIQNLARELDKDVKSGEISRLNQQYQSLASFVKEHEQYKKDHPEDYNRALSYFMQDFQSDPLRRKAFDWFQLAKPVDDTKFKEGLLKLKASSVERTTKDGYIEGTEGVPREQIEAYTRSFLSNPENKAYIQQQIRFKNPDYYDAELERLHPETGGYFEELKVDSETGRTLTDEEVESKEKIFLNKMEAYKKLSEEKKKRTPPPVLDYQIKKGAVSKYIDDAVSTASYTKTTLKEDPVKAQAKALSQQMAIAQMNNRFKLLELDEKTKSEDKKLAMDALGIVNANLISLSKISETEATPQVKAQIDALNKEKAKILNGLVNLGVNYLEDSPDTNTIKEPFKINSFGGGNKFSVVPQEGIEVDNNTVLKETINLSIPKNFFNLAREVNTQGNNPNIHLYKEYSRILKNHISKISDKSTRKMSEGFLEYINNLSKEESIGSKNSEELVHSYLEKYYKEPPRPTSTISPKDRYDAIIKRQKYESFLNSYIIPTIEKFNGELKKGAQGEARIFTLSSAGSKNIKASISEDPTGYTYYKVKPNGIIDMDNKVESNDKEYIQRLLREVKPMYIIDAKFPGQESSKGIKAKGLYSDYIAIPKGTNNNIIEGLITGGAGLAGEKAYLKELRQSKADNARRLLGAQPYRKDIKGIDYRTITDTFKTGKSNTNKEVIIRQQVNPSSNEDEYIAFIDGMEMGRDYNLFQDNNTKGLYNRIEETLKNF